MTLEGMRTQNNLKKCIIWILELRKICKKDHNCTMTFGTELEEKLCDLL